MVGFVHVIFSSHLEKAYTKYCPLSSPRRAACLRVYFCLSGVCYRNFEPLVSQYERTRLLMREIMANFSGAVLVEMILSPMHILRQGRLA